MEWSVSGARKIMQQYSKAQNGGYTRIVRLLAPFVCLTSVSNQILNVFRQF
jgi:hypothetical protein